jgi:CheY-like chemotaxis protein
MQDMTGWHILIVEDEPDGQEVIAELLGHFHVTNNVASTAEEALELLSHEQYTAAIIDLGLPGMDGLTLLKTIRENPDTATLPCIAFTAFHSSLVKKQAIEMGCNAYLTKPLNDSHFMQELGRVIESV